MNGHGDEVLGLTAYRLRHVVASMQSAGRVPSVVAGVVRDGRLFWSGSAGDVDASVASDTAYRIGSITKTFVAVLVAQLRDEGRLSFDDRVDQHVSGTGVGDRTIRELLSHTAGVAAEPAGSWWERCDGVDDVVGLTCSGAVVGDAGVRHHYSNLGFAVLGRVVEQCRGESWLEVLSRRVLMPLGMGHTAAAPVGPSVQGFAVHPYADVVLPEPHTDTKAMGPAGQLWSTVRDLASWAVFVSGDTGGVLSGDTVAEMTQMVVVAEAAAWESGQGLGWQLLRSRGRRLVGHGGSMPGFQAGLWHDVDSRDSVVVLFNATSTTYQGITGQLLSVVDECQPAMPLPWVADGTVSGSLLEVAGVWHWGTRAITVRVDRGGGLGLSTEGSRSSRFRPSGTDEWVGLDGYYAGETLRIVRDDTGRVRHINVATFVLTRRPYDDAEPIPGGFDDGYWRTS